MRHTIAHARWRHVGPLLAVLLAAAAPLGAQTVTPNATPGDPDDPFARRGWHLELSGHGVLEAWNYNLNHEEMFGPYAGLTYGIGKGVVLTLGWPLYYVSQRGVDAYLLGVTWGARGRIVRRGPVSVFWELEVGLSEADPFTPPRGTRFNYLAQGSSGTTIRIRPGMHLLAAVKWIHVSNASLAGRDRNPDIEAVGLKAGMLIGF